MNRKLLSTAPIFCCILFFGTLVLSKPALAQSDCPAPGFTCPVAYLFTDGVYFVYGTGCCTPDGPACIQNFCTDLMIYKTAIPAADFGCEASPGGGNGCACKTSETPDGNSTGTGGNGELTFDPDNATAVSVTTGKCDDFFVKVDNAVEYYRCYNISFKYQGNVGGGKIAIHASKKPTNFTVQAYSTAKTVVDGINVLQVEVPDGSGGTETKTFNIVQKLQ